MGSSVPEAGPRSADSPRGSAPPLILLYDGHCRFCEHASARLVHLAAPGAIQRQDFHQPGVLGRFPTITAAQADAAMQLITPNGVAIAGAHALYTALATRPLLRPVLWMYRLPVVRPLNDWLYRLVASSRYRLLGRVRPAPACETDACRIQ